MKLRSYFVIVLLTLKTKVFTSFLPLMCIDHSDLPRKKNSFFTQKLYLTETFTTTAHVFKQQSDILSLNSLYKINRKFP